MAITTPDAAEAVRTDPNATLPTPPTDRTAALLTLMAMLSPSFPTGSYSYSHGLETACTEGRIADTAGLRTWLGDLIERGAGWNDAVLLAQAHRRAADGQDLTDIAQFAEALAGSLERWQETIWQGQAFIDAARIGWPCAALETLPEGTPYAVAVGTLAGAHGIAAEAALAAFLQGFASALIQAAIRLGVTGQQGGVATLTGLQPLVSAAAQRAAASSLDDLGGFALISDIMAMRHEVQETRLFRT